MAEVIVTGAHVAGAALIRVQVCHALPDSAFIADVTLAAGSTLRQAVELSGLLRQHPSIDLTVQKIGVFGKIKPHDAVLRDGDRVEVYRPLQADPKETRRRRAQHKAVEGR